VKLEITARIIDDSGNDVVAPTGVGADVPEFEQFIDGSNFIETFDKFERPALQARSALFSELSERYLDELFKKKPQLKPCRRQNGV
jgi:hypothetical protein